MSRILLLEDDTMIASGILYALESEGYETNHATRIKDARSLIEFLELIGYLQKLQIMMHAGWTYNQRRIFPEDSGTGEEDKKEDSSKEQMEKQWQCH